MTGEPRSGGETGGEEPPPVLGSWRRLYAAVLLFLAVQVVLYWALTRAFR